MNVLNIRLQLNCKTCACGAPVDFLFDTFHARDGGDGPKKRRHLRGHATWILLWLLVFILLLYCRLTGVVLKFMFQCVWKFMYDCGLLKIEFSKQ